MINPIAETPEYIWTAGFTPQEYSRIKGGETGGKALCQAEEKREDLWYIWGFW